MSSGSSGVSNASTASASKFQLLSVPKDQSSQNSSDAMNSTPDSNQLCLNEKNEPIYAVVNLKDKYENRAKKKSIDEQHVIDYIPRRERPNSFHVVSGDYEEVCMYGSVNSVTACYSSQRTVFFKLAIYYWLTGHIRFLYFPGIAPSCGLCGWL